MNEYLSYLEVYGYKAPEVDYDVWKKSLEKYVTAGSQEKYQEQLALMPLYYFCVNDLPATTRAPELDDRNTVSILKEDAEVWTDVDESSGSGISKESVGKMLRFLMEIGFVEKPYEKKGRPLPELGLSEAQLSAIGAVGGRGGASK